MVLDMVQVQRKLAKGWTMDKFNIADLVQGEDVLRETHDTFKQRLASPEFKAKGWRIIIVAEASHWDERYRRKGVRLIATEKGFEMRRYGEKYVKTVEKQELTTKHTLTAVIEFIDWVNSYN